MIKTAAPKTSRNSNARMNVDFKPAIPRAVIKHKHFTKQKFFLSISPNKR